MNRFRITGPFLSACALLNSCTYIKTAVDRDLRYPGGLGGAVFDRYYAYDASASKQLQLFRATVALALLSRIATANIRDGKEADAYISHLQNAANEINYIAIHLYTERLVPCAGDPGIGVGTGDCRPALFESDIPNLERALFNAAFAGLPKEDAVEMWRSARAMNVMGAIWSALKLAARSVDGVHRAAGVHRSGIELFAQVAEADRRRVDAARGGTPTDAQSIPTITEALCYIGFDAPAEIGCPTFADPMFTAAQRKPAPGQAKEALASARAAYRARLARVEIGREAYESVYRMIRISCRMLPLSVNDDGSNPADARRTRCATLKLEPVSRLKDPPAAPPAAAPPVGPADPAGGDTG